MAEKTLQEFSAPSPGNIRVGPILQMDNLEFELQPSLINLVQDTTFNGKAQEYATAHLQDFLEIGSTIIVKDVAQNTILLWLFPFSLEGKVKQWFYDHKEDINTWESVQKPFCQSFSL
jgi:hypothetical protein